MKCKKWKRKAPVKYSEKPPKYQSANRVKFKAMEILSEADYQYETQQ